MTAPIIGKDCDIVLVHPQVNGGDPYGFVLSPDPQKSGSAFSIQRNLDENGDTFIFLFATILLADDLKNPDGSEHTDNKVTMYEMLLDFLDHVDEISISTFDGTFLGLGQLATHPPSYIWWMRPISASSLPTSPPTTHPLIPLFASARSGSPHPLRSMPLPGGLQFGDERISLELHFISSIRSKKNVISIKFCSFRRGRYPRLALQQRARRRALSRPGAG